MPAMAKRATTKSWASQRTATEAELKAAFASSRCSIIRTAIRATRTASTSSRKSTRPTTSSRTATSAPPMTASAMPPSSRAWAAARTASAPISARPSPTSSKASSAWAAARAARRRAASAAPTCATTWRSRSRRPIAGKTAQIRIPTSVTCEACSGTGAKAGTKPKTCPTCGGAGKIRHAQGFFTLERTCPACQGRGQVIDDPVPVLLGLRPRHARAHAVGQHSGRRRGRHPHPARRRRRGRRARRAAGRSLYFPVARAARVLPARRRRPALPRADLDGDGGARRRVRGADDRRQQGAGQGAGRHPVRPPLPPDRQGHAGAARRNRPATCTFRSWSRRRRT